LNFYTNTMRNSQHIFFEDLEPKDQERPFHYGDGVYTRDEVDTLISLLPDDAKVIKVRFTDDIEEVKQIHEKNPIDYDNND